MPPTMYSLCILLGALQGMIEADAREMAQAHERELVSIRLETAFARPVEASEISLFMEAE